VFFKPRGRGVVSLLSYLYFNIVISCFSKNDYLNDIYSRKEIVIRDANHISTPTISSGNIMSILFYFALKLCLSEGRGNLKIDSLLFNNTHAWMIGVLSRCHSIFNLFHLFNPLTPVPPITGPDEGWPLLHL